MTTYYSWGGSSVLAEYTESTGNGATFKIAKSYFYAGSRLLSTQVWNGSTETTEFHHPDRLGTKLVTNNAANTSYEQSTLPFGTALAAESSGFSNQVFTSYDRSAGTGLDYAVNRNYSSGQGRFTTVDPIGMGSGSITDPQSNNLYAYALNSPIDYVDPSGLTVLPAYENDIDEITCTYEISVTKSKTDVRVLEPHEELPYSLEYTGGEIKYDFDLVMVCRSKPKGKPTGPDLPEPNGGEPPTSKPGTTDPCAGKKGTLDFQKRWSNHIFPRHVAVSQWPKKSKYVFIASEWTENQYKSSVQSIGQTTFENGVYTTASNGNHVYSYATWGYDYGPNNWLMFWPVGYDGASGALTNINTIVVSSDCKTVLTAHPGLPAQFKLSDVPGGMIKPNGSTLKHRAVNF